MQGTMENRNNGSFHEGTQNREKYKKVLMRFQDEKSIVDKGSSVYLVTSYLAISSG
jgi:hypothetical protein